MNDADKGNEMEDAFAPRENKKPYEPAERWTHKIVHQGATFRCKTDSRGYATPGNKRTEDLVLEASDGFIPLWKKDVTLRWRFNDASMGYFKEPAAAKRGLKTLLSKAVLGWGDAAPVRFSDTDDVWDFEIVMQNADDCDNTGCVLASAFFPDPGRHKLLIYPKMLTQSTQDQIGTLQHEIGHVFGLRHFFAALKESKWPSVVFGEHVPFTIMNYGHDSVLTETDKSDLKKLYDAVWSGQLTAINGTKIVQVRPYHELG